MNKKLYLIAGALLSCIGITNLSAQDAGCTPPPLIDTNNYGVMFGTKGQETKKLVFSGLIQADYNFIVIHDEQRNPGVQDPTDRTNYLMRRVRVGFDADLGNNWRGVIDLQFNGKREKSLFVDGLNTGGSPPNPRPATITTKNKNGIFGIHNAYVEKVYGGNSFKAGYKKVNFGAEEMTLDQNLKAIERSIANEYFNECTMTVPTTGSPLGIGARYVGLYADGLYNGIGYGLALTNGFQGNCLSARFNNELSIFGNLYYTGEFNCIDIEIGINGSYKPKGNNFTLSTPPHTATLPAFRGSIAAINPYLIAKWNKLYVMVDVLASKVERGAIDGNLTAFNDASPYGITIMPTYMIKDNLEIVGRYSHLDTDFRGAQICAIVPGADNTVGQPTITPAGDIYDNATAGYIGYNYYMMNKTVMFSGGYEFIHFKDRAEGNTVQDFTGAKTDVHVLRTRVQLLF